MSLDIVQKEVIIKRMVKNSNNLWLVVIIAIVVALAVSLITANITGNIIKQKNDLFGTYKVYTTSETYSKAEVDAKLNTISDNIRAGIKCAMLSPQEYKLQVGESANTDDGKILSISYIDSKVASIKIGGTLGQITTTLHQGEMTTLGDGTSIGVQQILYSSVTTTKSSAQITYLKKCISS